VSEFTFASLCVLAPSREPASFSSSNSRKGAKLAKKLAQENANQNTTRVKGARQKIWPRSRLLA
jgi:hypothetical protein